MVGQSFSSEHLSLWLALTQEEYKTASAWLSSLDIVRNNPLFIKKKGQCLEAGLSNVGHCDYIRELYWDP